MKSSVTLLLVVIGSILSQAEAAYESSFSAWKSYYGSDLLNPGNLYATGLLPYGGEEEIMMYMKKCRKADGKEAVRKGMVNLTFFIKLLFHLRVNTAEPLSLAVTHQWTHI
ncbi:hypothetical protein J437_LFUL007018 [Ladona fulva]|uniref:Uncharacterized protein n=1 Tax=Ladona fulva TaxID=123851 RepID=A0A8K0K6T3_LADFU|nr:hypothetical protein J437_LFUL007018 [Ladona fulva]